MEYGIDYAITYRFDDKKVSFIGNSFEEAFKNYLSEFPYRIETKISKILEQCDYKKNYKLAENSFLVALGMPLEFTVRERYMNDGAMLDFLNLTKYINTPAFKSDRIVFYFKDKEIFDLCLNKL